MSENPTARQFAQAADDLCVHGWDGPCVDCTEKAIAAAEERGRRRGVEERDELRTALRNIVGVWKEIHDDAKQRRMWILGWNTWLKVIAEGVAIAPCDSDLNAKVDRDALHERAPRDSGKET